MTRPFTVIDCEQRSDDWVAARLGRVGSSQAAAVMAKIKSGEAAARRNLRVQLVLERITGQTQERSYVSQEMQDGIDREPDALAHYEALSGQLVERVGYVAHASLPVGASPDGVIGPFTGLVEAKCPSQAIHLGYLMTGKIPVDYLWQITHQLFVTGADWCDWLSYQPSFPDPLKAKLVRVQRADLDLVAYEQELVRFLGEVEQGVAEVRALMEQAA